MKAKLFPSLALAALALFAGCQSQPITNLTVPQVPQNPSDIYTLSMNAQINEATLVPGSLNAFIVIDGAEHPMRRSPYGLNIFEYDYRLPADRSTAKYYYILRYRISTASTGITNAREVKGSLQTLTVLDRYVLTMEASRGPVGANITVVGRGFLRTDRVVIGGIEAPTTFNNANSLRFTVPALPAGRDYAVELQSGGTVMPMGLFRVDVATMSVSPSSLTLAPGESVPLVVSILPQRAPEGGVPVDVLTDVPASVVMPEFGIAAGEPSASVRVTGGAPGSGALHITAPGFNEVIVPIKVVVPEVEIIIMPPAPPPSQPADAVMGS